MNISKKRSYSTTRHTDMSLFGKIEQQILHSMQERLVIDTKVEETKDGNIHLVTTTTFDGTEVSQHDFDLEPLIQIILSRLKKT